MSALGSIGRALRAVYSSVLPTYTSGQIGDLQLTDRGLLRIDAGAGAAGAPAGGVQSVQGVAGGTRLPVAIGPDYETVAASQTAQALGATGATGDWLDGVLIVPATTSPGAVQVKDGAGGAITIFTGGTDSVVSLVPFFVPFPARSAAGAWQVTTGANVSAVAFGDFT